jgi:hypothetical protein
MGACMPKISNWEYLEADEKLNALHEQHQNLWLEIEKQIAKVAALQGRLRALEAKVTTDLRKAWLSK